MKKTVLGCIVFLLGAVLAAQEAAAAAGAFLQSNAAQVASNDLADSTPNARVAMATADYPVTAGDVYSLAFAAGTEPVSYTIPVDSTYKIRVANLGVISCAGLTYLQLKQQVEALVTKNYIMSGVQFVLVMPGSFKVTVTGEVTRTQEKSAWALTRLSSIVAGTFTDYSSDRDITVESSSGKKHVYDLYKARRNGALDQDPYVRPGQTVTVNRVLRKVTISGAVERPGSYELMKGENLRTLVENYGSGLTDVADTSRITLIRTLDGKDTSGSTVYLDASALNADYELFNRDSIVIASISDLLPYITVEGIINNPSLKNKDEELATEGKSAENVTASYKTIVRFHEGETYATLARRMAGQFNNYSDLEHAYIMRKNQQIAIDLAYLLYNAGAVSQYRLEKDDKLVIPFTQNFTNKIVVNGEVTAVTEKTAWPLKRLSEVIGDLTTPYSSTREVTVTGPEGNKTTYDLFLSTRFGDMSQNPYIQSGDTVTVNRIDRKVTISGAVERPGTYELLKGENLKDLVEKYGGGLAPLADSSRMELYRITDEKNSGKQYYLSAKDIADNTALICYDSVKVCSYTDLQSAMFIEGAVSIGTVATNLETSSRITVTFHEGENYASLVRRMKTIFSASSDTAKAYIIRTVKAEGKGDEAAYEQKKIPINLDEILYDASFYSVEYVHKDDTLLVPFRQFFVTVAGAVNSPGRFPYIPDRTWDYYVALAGGIDSYRNALDAVDIVDVAGKRHDKSEVIEPEATITVKENSLLYKWNKVSGSITSILSIIATVLSILVVTGKLGS